MPFDLMTYLNERFPTLELDAGLFYRWPVGIRFDLGGQPRCSAEFMSAVLQRAATLYEALFTADDRCVVIAQDWPLGDAPPPRYNNLYGTPGTGLSAPQGSFEINAREESEDDHSCTLQWSEVAARGFRYRAILLGIANQDRGLIPAIASNVYFLNAEKHLIMHMYDDRGLDVIASEKESLRAIYSVFTSWIPDYDRSRIDRIFMPYQQGDQHA